MVNFQERQRNHTQKRNSLANSSDVTDLLVVFMRAEGLEMMRGKVRPLNPALWRGDAAHGNGVVSCKGYHGHAMAPCLSLLIERQGAQKRSGGLDRWKRVGSRARGEARGGAG